MTEWTHEEFLKDFESLVSEQGINIVEELQSNELTNSNDQIFTNGRPQCQLPLFEIDTADFRSTKEPQTEFSLLANTKFKSSSTITESLSSLQFSKTGEGSPEFNSTILDQSLVSTLLSLSETSPKPESSCEYVQLLQGQPRTELSPFGQAKSESNSTITTMSISKTEKAVSSSTEVQLFHGQPQIELSSLGQCSTAAQSSNSSVLQSMLLSNTELSFTRLQFLNTIQMNNPAQAQSSSSQSYLSLPHTTKSKSSPAVIETLNSQSVMQLAEIKSQSTPQQFTKQKSIKTRCGSSVTKAGKIRKCRSINVTAKQIVSAIQTGVKTQLAEKMQKTRTANSTTVKAIKPALMVGQVSQRPIWSMLPMLPMLPMPMPMPTSTSNKGASKHQVIKCAPQRKISTSHLSQESKCFKSSSVPVVSTVNNNTQRILIPDTKPGSVPAVSTVTQRILIPDKYPAATTYNYEADVQTKIQNDFIINNFLKQDGPFTIISLTKDLLTVALDKVKGPYYKFKNPCQQTIKYFQSKSCNTVRHNCNLNSNLIENVQNIKERMSKSNISCPPVSISESQGNVVQNKLVKPALNHQNSPSTCLPKQSKVQCGLCNIFFLSKNIFDKHMKSVHQETTNPVNNVQNTPPVNFMGKNSGQNTPPVNTTAKNKDTPPVYTKNVQNTSPVNTIAKNIGQNTPPVNTMIKKNTDNIMQECIFKNNELKNKTACKSRISVNILKKTKFDKSNNNITIANRKQVLGDLCQVKENNVHSGNTTGTKNEVVVSQTAMLGNSSVKNEYTEYKSKNRKDIKKDSPCSEHDVSGVEANTHLVDKKAALSAVKCVKVAANTLQVRTKSPVASIIKTLVLTQNETNDQNKTLGDNNIKKEVQNLPNDIINNEIGRTQNKKLPDKKIEKEVLSPMNKTSKKKSGTQYKNLPGKKIKKEVQDSTIEKELAMTQNITMKNEPLKSEEDEIIDVENLSINDCEEVISELDFCPFSSEHSVIEILGGRKMNKCKYCENAYSDIFILNRHLSACHKIHEDMVYADYRYQL